MSIMDQLKVYPHSYMNILLVAEGLKPASELEFTYEGDDGDILKQQCHSENYLYFFKKHLEELNIYSKFRKFKNQIGVDRNINVGVEIYLANSSNNLERVLTVQTNYGKGLAFGFPDVACQLFGKEIDGKKRYATSHIKEIIDAKNQGIEIPSWLSYLSHVPEPLDWKSNKIKKGSSKELGLQYQEFIRKNYPELSQIVEKEYFETFPSRYEEKSEKISILYEKEFLFM